VRNQAGSLPRLELHNWEFRVRDDKISAWPAGSRPGGCETSVAGCSLLPLSVILKLKLILLLSKSQCFKLWLNQ